MAAEQQANALGRMPMDHEEDLRVAKRAEAVAKQELLRSFLGFE